MNELSAITNASVYNQVYPLSKPDYARDVTDESKKAFVLVLLTSSAGGTSTESRVASEAWQQLARTFGDVPPGAAFWYENSSGLAEIAVNAGSAAAVLGLRPGAAIGIA